VRKQIQRALMILDGMGVPFKPVDITVRGNEAERDFMREHAARKDPAVVALPPQFFWKEEYLGNFGDFDDAVESNTLEDFLRLLPPEEPQAQTSTTSETETEEGAEDEYEDEEEEYEDEEEEASVSHESSAEPEGQTEDGKIKSSKEVEDNGDDDDKTEVASQGSDAPHENDDKENLQEAHDDTTREV
ncbi:SH3BGR protein, partial [Aphelenchoides avenae]